MWVIATCCFDAFFGSDQLPTRQTSTEERDKWADINYASHSIVWIIEKRCREKETEKVELCKVNCGRDDTHGWLNAGRISEKNQRKIIKWTIVFENEKRILRLLLLPDIILSLFMVSCCFERVSLCLCRFVYQFFVCLSPGILLMCICKMRIEEIWTIWRAKNGFYYQFLCFKQQKYDSFIDTLMFIEGHKFQKFKNNFQEESPHGISRCILTTCVIFLKFDSHFQCF